MEFKVCPSCSSDIPDQAIYCPNCAKQIRCKSCKEFIEPQWRACIKCGTLVGEIRDNILKEPPPTVSPAVNTAVNTIEYRETKKSRSMRATFTDSVGNGLTETLSYILATRIGEREPRNQRTQLGNPRQRELPLLNGVVDGAAEPRKEVDSAIDVEVEPPLQGGAVGNEADTENIKRVFRFDSNKLVLINKELKATTKIDFTRRLVCLFIYYNELKGTDKVPRSDVMTLLEDNSCNNGNARDWLANNKELVAYTDGIGLTEKGQELAKNALKQILDQNFHPPAAKAHSRKSQSIGDVQAKSGSKVTKTRKPSSTAASGRLGPMVMLDRLIKEGFFKERRTISDILTHCKSTFAYVYKSTDFSAPLARLLREPKRLRRETNKEGQYEYFS